MRDPRRGAARRLRASDDRGMSAVEFVVLTPIMFILLMMTVQFALYMFARQAAQGAVNAGGRAAREQAGNSRAACTSSNAPWIGAAQQAVSVRAASLGRNLLDAKGPVTVSSTATAAGGNAVGACPLSSVSVTYTSKIPTILPVFQFSVTVNSSGPVEQLVRHP